jgi:uncharacterized coiled-coil DUF342 family protein
MRDRLQELTGTDRITTDQGDYVGTIPDEDYRERILDCYNSTEEADLKEKIDDLENAIGTKKDTIEEQQDEIRELKREVAYLQDELAEYNNTIRELREQLQNHAD